MSRIAKHLLPDSAKTNKSGRLEIGGCDLIEIAERFGEQQPITVLFRPARQRWLQDLVANARARPNLFTAPTNLAGVKQLITSGLSTVTSVRVEASQTQL